MFGSAVKLLSCLPLPKHHNHNDSNKTKTSEVSSKSITFLPNLFATKFIPPKSLASALTKLSLN